MFEWIDPILLKFYNLFYDDKKDFKNYGYRNHNYTTYIDYNTLRPYLEGYIRLLQFSVMTKDYHNRFDPLIKPDVSRYELELIMMTEG